MECDLYNRFYKRVYPFWVVLEALQKTALDSRSIPSELQMAEFLHKILVYIFRVLSDSIHV
jgi:hypothetical protein